MLKLDGVVAAYDDVICLHGVSLEVRRGEIVTLIGANGAGKSTTLKTISGLLTPRAGTIEFDGRTIAGRSPDAIVALGLVQVPEGRRMFPELSVEMIEVGESTGALPAMLNSVAEFYEEDVQTALGATMALIEPVILIVMAVFVGGVLISLYMPIFSLGANIH